MSATPAQLDLVADEVGRLKDRLARVETSVLAQKAPLFAAEKVLAASAQAMTVATTGLQALIAHHQAATAPKKPSRRRR